MNTLTTSGIDFFFKAKPNHLGMVCKALKSFGAMHKDLDIEPGFKFIQESSVSHCTRGKLFTITVRHTPIATACMPMLLELPSIMADLGLSGYEGAEFYVEESPAVVQAYMAAIKA